jgi:MFS family permease
VLDSRSRLAPLANGRFRLLFLATLGSGIGNWLAVVALQVDVYERTHSGWWVGALLAASVIPAVVIGLLLGPLVDRLSRKGLMVVSDVGRLVVFCALPVVGSAPAIVALALIAGIGTAFFTPAVLAGVPNLVEADEVDKANGMLQTAERFATTAGPLLGGALVALAGPDLVYLLNAATFLLSAALILAIPARLLQSERPVTRGHWRDLGEGYAAVRSSPALITVLVAWSIAVVANALFNTAEIFLVRDAFDSNDFGFGLMWAAAGAGMVAGALSAPAWIAKRGMRGAYPWVLATFAAGIAAAAVAPDVWVGAAAMLVAGVGNGAAIVCNIGLVQRGAPDAVRGRAFTLIISANYVVMFAAFMAAGPLTDALGPRWVAGLAGATLAAATLVGATLVRGVSEPVPAAVPEAA